MVYEDRSCRCDAALDPLMQVIKQQSELGKPILGICNGAQILVESGLMPGMKIINYHFPTDNKRVQQGQVRYEVTIIMGSCVCLIIINIMLSLAI